MKRALGFSILLAACSADHSGAGAGELEGQGGAGTGNGGAAAASSTPSIGGTAGEDGSGSAGTRGETSGGAGATAEGTGGSNGTTGSGGTVTGSGSSGDVGGAGGSGASDNTGGQAGAPSTTDLEFVSHPVFTPSDNVDVPLVGTLSFETSQPSTASILVSGDDEQWTLQLDAPGTTHEKIILGLKPDTDYELIVTAEDDIGAVTSAPVQWRSSPLPDDFPDIQLVLSDPARMEPGMTILDLDAYNVLVVVDEEGEIRWLAMNQDIVGHIILSNGNIAAVEQEGGIIEMDWFGQQLNNWSGAFTHSVHEMPSGNLLLLRSSRLIVEDYPTSATDPEPTETRQIKVESVVELGRSGEAVKEIRLSDLLDPTRINHLSEGGDWSHANAAVYDPDSDAYLVSLRHQDVVIKIDRESESLVWILGDHANWKDPWVQKLLSPVGDDFEWQYAQHAVEVTPEGIIVYDNGNVRAPAFVVEPPSGGRYSRAVRFAIDEQAMTVSQHWTYQPVSNGVVLFSGSRGDADVLPITGNVLVDTATAKVPDGRLNQIAEVTSSGEVVFQLETYSSEVEVASFESERIPDIRFMNLE